MKRTALLGMGIITVLLCLFVVSCSPQSSGSGISGHVVAAPSPVNGSPAPSVKPFTDAVIVVRDRQGGKEVARQKVDAQGGFKVSLPVGTYFVDPVNGSGTVLPYAPPQTVEVREGVFTDITVTFDLGLK